MKEIKSITVKKNVSRLKLSTSSIMLVVQKLFIIQIKCSSPVGWDFNFVDDSFITFLDLCGLQNHNS